MTDDTETTQNLALEQAGKQAGNKKFQVVISKQASSKQQAGRQASKQASRQQQAIKKKNKK